MISKSVPFGSSGGRCFVLAAGLMVCTTPGLAADDEAAASTRPRRPVPIIFQAAGEGSPVLTPPAGTTTPITLDSGLLKPPVHQESTLFTQYRQALERESRRLVDRNPTVFSDTSVDEDGYPLRGSDRVQRDARRLFGGASSRVMSSFVEKLLDSSAGGRAARGAIEGLRVDLRKGGGVGVSAGTVRESSDIKASVGFVLLGRPRVEVRSNLPGNLRTRLEIPLDSLGFRATMSHKFTSTGWRSTFTVGSEEDDRWVSAGFEVDF